MPQQYDGFTTCRGGSKAALAASGLVPLRLEPIVEAGGTAGPMRIKVGDGTTAAASLPYVDIAKPASYTAGNLAIYDPINVAIVDSGTAPSSFVQQTQYNADMAAMQSCIDGTDGAVYQYARTSINDIYSMLSVWLPELTPEIQTVTLTNTMDYPFNNSIVTVALKTARNTSNYDVSFIPQVDYLNIGDIVITNRLLNGFKIAYTGSAASVTLSLIIRGGMSV
ncbi:hypothetical protein FACS1894184_16410 [Clostridia bacterium]|nr:hypothetical protein FACS1894184_16410 [Clostridia bacterium]